METISDHRRPTIHGGRTGSALLIVLALVVLLTTLTLAFFSRSVLEAQVSNGSANQVKVDNFATGAVATILSDLKQEIEAGSSTPTFPVTGNNYIYYYTPTATSGTFPSMLPAVTGSAAGLPPGATFGSNSLGSGALVNLIKVSLHGAKFYAGVAPYSSTPTNPTRAAAISTGSASDSNGTIASGSTDGTSLNGRYVTGTRWNKPLFLAPGTVFPLPDWIYVERTPTALVQNATAWNANLKASPTDMTTSTTVLGRYAYAIYDEGGLLDINVAGAPTPLLSTGTLNSLGAYKTGEALADLTQIPGLTQTLADKIVGWRNNASAAQWLGTATSTPLTGNVNSGYTWNNTNGSNYFYNVAFNPTGFLRPVSTGTSTGTIAQTDQFFTTRQQLLQFFTTVLGGGNTVNGALQYLTHFSRDLNQPSYAPSATKVSNAPILSLTKGGNDEGGFSTAGGGTYDNTLNPAFLGQRVTTAFIRNDGSQAVVGDPLVKKRFALMRLAWLTYQGPSAGRNGVATGTTASSSPGSSDYDIYLLENTYGIPQSFLAQGTAANIYKYFGLSWIPDTRTDVYGNAMDSASSSKWVYRHTSANPTGSTPTSPITSLPAHPGSRNAGPSGTITTIYTLPEVAAAGRDPDFVELLKATICAGSIGKAQTAFLPFVNAGNPGNAGTPAAVQNALDVSVDTQIIQMAANIIAQYKTDAFAPRILFDDGNWSIAMEYRGVEDLPYFFRIRSLVFPMVDSSPPISYAPKTNFLGTSPGIAGDAYDPTLAANIATTPSGTLANSGMGAAFNAVEIWDPHSWNTGTTSPVLTNLRPTTFRIVAVGGPPTIAAPPASSDPNTITMQAYTRLSASGLNDYESSVPTSTVVTSNSPSDFRHAVSFTPSNSGLIFNIPQTALGLALFREPTLLIKPGIPNGSNLHFAGDPKAAAAGTEGTNQVITDATTYSFTSSKVADPVSGYLGIKALGQSVGNTWVGTTPGSPQTYPITASDYPTTPAPGYTNNNLYLGTYLGLFPLKWSGLDSFYNKTYVITADTVVTSGSSGVNPPNLTYRLQYLDPNNGTNWITYDEKYTGVTVGIRGLAFYNQNGSPPWLNLVKIMGETKQDGFNNLYLDPRTSRFGGFSNNYSYAGIAGDTMPGWSQAISGTSTPAAAFALASAQQNATWGVDLDETIATLSYIISFGSDVGSGANGVLGWYPPASLNVNGYPALFCQNNPALTSPQAEFFADPDAIVRRGMSGYVQPTSSQPAVTRPGGISTATSPTAPSGLAEVVSMDYTNAATTGAVQVNGGKEAPSRPIMLNRPFRSVADLGYVFSGTPWRNLDMMTPESGAAALLDVFCINDTDDPNSLVAGKVNLNTRQPLVLKAILAGAYKDEWNPSTATIGASGGAATADVIAGATGVGLTSRTSSTAAGAGPLTNISELVGKYSSTVPTSVTTSPQTIDGSQSYVGFSGTQTPVSPAVPSSTPPNLSSILTGDNATSGLPVNYATANVERYREATVRALSNCGQTRTWNLMIDVIAQTGRFPSTAGTLGNFLVEGEQRYWVHLAIDRMTGQVIDQQIEVVKE